jgi:hypothetical protein
MISNDFRIAGWLVASALALAAPAARAQGVVEQTVSSGASGALYGRDASRDVFAYATQTTSRTGGAQALLVVQIDEASSTVPGGMSLVLFGSGAIPAADVTSNGLGQLVVDTDTTGNAAFTTIACPNPLPATPPYCTPAANPGRVRVVLSRAAGTPVSHQDGQWTSDYGTIRITQTGAGEVVAANGDGFVGATAFPAGATGSIGMTRDVLVVVEQGQ